MACAGLYYRKSFTVEPEIIGQRFWLEFEGIAGITEVWLNKKPIAKHNNPYTSFWVEVTNLLQAGDNEITVYTDNRTKPNSRWYVGCGIYRSVWLHMASAVSVAPHGIRAVTAALDGSAPEDKLRLVLDMSYTATAPKLRKRKLDRSKIRAGAAIVACFYSYSG